MSSHRKGPGAPGEGLPAAEALSLKELVNYSDGAVVSRIMTKNQAGNVTLFSFDSGQGLSEHSAPFDALVYIIDGRAELTIGGKSVTAATGEAVLMPADIPHALHAVERFKMLLIMIRG